MTTVDRYEGRTTSYRGTTRIISRSPSGETLTATCLSVGSVVVRAGQSKPSPAYGPVATASSGGPPGRVSSRLDRKRDERDVKKAQREAEAAEEAAADALDYALWVVDQAELAVLDAIDARSWADARAAASPPS